PSALREHLARTLPAYMVPAAFVALSAWPLTPNAKIDRRALPAPISSLGPGRAEHVPPRDRLELELVAIWEALLGAHPIGVRDNFFALGGHSLLAVRLVAQIESRLAR